MIFFDPDGKEFARHTVRDGPAAETAFSAALKVYSNKEISWATGSAEESISAASSIHKPVVLAFLDSGKDSEAILQTLQHPWLARNHDKFIFTRVEFDKTSAAARDFAVTSAPTLVLVNPLEGDVKKRAIEKIVGKKTVNSLRTSLAKALAKVAK